MVERKKYLYSNDILVSSGKGGNGCISFRREALVPKGGPDGGDGGRGGSIFIRGSKKLETIADFKYKRVFRAQNGRDGSSNNKTGTSGSDLVIKVPIGTEIWRDEQLLFDVLDETPRLVAKGGKGGMGNQHFATPDLQAPYIATEGGLAEEFILDLVLKHMADIGVVGMPNAGKSTLVYKISRAPVKIGDYAFSTMYPVLGVVKQTNIDKAKKADRIAMQDAILKLELDLLSPEVRKSRETLDLLIADDFVELGLSGQLYNKQDILEALPKEEKRQFQLSAFRATQLSEELILATYELEEIAEEAEGTRASIRSSLWRADGSKYQLVFHQGLKKGDSELQKQLAEDELADAETEEIDNTIDEWEEAELEEDSGLEEDDFEDEVDNDEEAEEELKAEIDEFSNTNKEHQQNIASKIYKTSDVSKNMFDNTGHNPTSALNNSELRARQGEESLAMDASEQAKSLEEPQRSGRLIIADLPGLLQGSHRNIGLGHRFLQHLQRCKLLLHVVDGSDPNAFGNFWTILQELRLYDPRLLQKQQLVCISKGDIAAPEQLLSLDAQIRQVGYQTLILDPDCSNLAEELFGGDCSI